MKFFFFFGEKSFFILLFFPLKEFTQLRWWTAAMCSGSSRVQGPGFVFTGSKESIRGSLDGVSLYIFHAVPHTLYTKF